MIYITKAWWWADGKRKSLDYKDSKGNGFRLRIPLEEFRRKFHRESGHYPLFNYYEL